MRLTKAWSTHIPMLLKYAQATNGPILELGAGIFSTPLLHWICAESNRKLVTYEKNERWFEFANQYRSKNHKVRLVKNWDKVDFTIDTHWSVVLVDHETDRRIIEVIRLKDRVDYMILHDTHHSVYEYDKIWSHFKYIYHWKYCKAHTSVVSNFKKL